MVKSIPERLMLHSDDELRQHFINQLIVEMVETFRLNFIGIEKVTGLMIDFDLLSYDLQNAINHDDKSNAHTLLCLSSVLIDHEMFEIKVCCLHSKEIWNPFDEPIICFAKRAQNFWSLATEQPVYSLIEIAEWINKKLCLYP